MSKVLLGATSIDDLVNKAKSNYPQTTIPTDSENASYVPAEGENYVPPAESKNDGSNDAGVSNFDKYKKYIPYVLMGVAVIYIISQKNK